jgi:outer membrane protein assembly factor BamD (BamD/ComL family)
MSDPSEKAYGQALQALKQKNYRAALEHFEQAGQFFKNNAELELLRNTTRLLVALQKELYGTDEVNSRLDIEEAFTDG